MDHELPVVFVAVNLYYSLRPSDTFKIAFHSRKIERQKYIDDNSHK